MIHNLKKMAKKERYKSRDEKDLNNNYTHINPNDLVLFDGTVEEFLSRITHRKPGFMKKPKGRTIIHWWWETKDFWYMNHGTQRITKNERYEFDGDNGWYIAPQMPTIIEQQIRLGFQMYFRAQK